MLQQQLHGQVFRVLTTVSVSVLQDIKNVETRLDWDSLTSLPAIHMAHLCRDPGSTCGTRVNNYLGINIPNFNPKLYNTGKTVFINVIIVCSRDVNG